MKALLTPITLLLAMLCLNNCYAQEECNYEYTGTVVEINAICGLSILLSDGSLLLPNNLPAGLTLIEGQQLGFSYVPATDVLTNCLIADEIIDITCAEELSNCNESVCNVQDPINELAWLADLLEPSIFTGEISYCAVTAYEVGGETLIYLKHKSNLFIADLPEVSIFTCTGDFVCSFGGFTFPEDQCSFQGYDFSSFNSGKVLFTNGCSELGTIPGLDNNCIDNCLIDYDLNCLQIFDPVCGCNNITYQNTCEAQKNGVISWTDGECQQNLPPLQLKAKAYLQGALYDSELGNMRDDLRAQNLIPLTEPYTDLPNFNHSYGGGGESINPMVLETLGPDAIIDWVLIELRQADDPSIIIATRSALIQADGDIVDTDGISPLNFNINTGGYPYFYIAIKHRNHIGVMSANPQYISHIPTHINFNDTSTYGDQAQVEIANKNALWAGNADSNNAIIYQGNNNDLNYHFFEVATDPANINNVLNFISTGYLNSDLNMDGQSIYQGINNDINYTFFNILCHPNNGGLITNYIIQEQIP